MSIRNVLSINYSFTQEQEEMINSEIHKHAKENAGFLSKYSVEFKSVKITGNKNGDFITLKGSGTVQGHITKSSNSNYTQEGVEEKTAYFNFDVSIDEEDEIVVESNSTTYI